MKLTHTLLCIALFFFVLVLIQGVQAAENYNYERQWGSFGTGDGQFNSPMGIAVNSTGYVYVSDFALDRIQIFDSSGTFIGKWGTRSDIADPQPGTFFGPYGIAIDGSDNVYVVDEGNDRVQVFNPNGVYMREFFSHTAAGHFIAVNSSGYVFVSDILPPSINIFRPNGTYLRHWDPSGGFGFEEPAAVAVDASDNVYVSDIDRDSIQKFTKGGTFLTEWGSSGSANGEFINPMGIAVDTAGNVLVADSGNNRIQKFDSTGGYLTQWGSFGTGNGQFNNSKGVSADSDGNVYVMDSGNNRIQKFTGEGGLNSCSDITEPGEYSLTTDILDSNSLRCINISSSDVIFNGNGFTIDGISLSSSVGFLVHNPLGTLENITITDVTVSNWNYPAIWFDGVNASTIKGVTATDNSGEGIRLDDSNHNNLTKNLAAGNRVGVQVEGNDNALIQNYFVNNSKRSDAIGLITVGSGNVLKDNIVSYNAHTGIWTIGINNWLENNSVHFNGQRGIQLGQTVYTTTGNTVVNNNVTDNGQRGITLYSSNQNYISNNRIRDNNFYGVYLNISSENQIFDNVIERNLVGLNLSFSSNNVVYNNYFNNSDNALDGSNTNLWNITPYESLNIIGGHWKAGNYWSNYGGVDTDSDGIGNTLVPYTNEGQILFGGDYSPLLYSHPVPIADFNFDITTGEAPLTVSFTDTSLNNPTGWVWFFGDELYAESWTQMTAGAEWTPRHDHSSVAMPNGDIVLMGGVYAGNTWYNDVWRSATNGATWMPVTGAAGWSARAGHSSVVLPDGSIVLMGGYTNLNRKNDTWRSTDNGTTWTQVNSSAGWSARHGHTSLAMPDGSIVLMGGLSDGNIRTNDTWRSTDKGKTWSRVNASSGWPARVAHSSVVMPDGSIVLMGGWSGGNFYNDVWRSVNNGVTWFRLNASAGWTGRTEHTSVVMPDGSIVLMGGEDKSGLKNDVWRSTDNGATWTQVSAGTGGGWSIRYEHSSAAMPDGSIVVMGGYNIGDINDVWSLMPAGSSAQNPFHTYTDPGVYSVALQVSNENGYDSTQKIGLISVTTSPEPVHNINSGRNFTTIQAAINAADTTAGHIIQVDPGSYTENIVVNKSLTIHSTSGTASDTTIQAGNNDSHVFNLTTNYVNISGFTVRNASGSEKAGIYLSPDTYNCILSNLQTTNNYYGIYLNSSNNNTISENNASGNADIGIILRHSSMNNTISLNNASGNSWYGFGISHSNNNTISQNTASGNSDIGIYLQTSSNNTVVRNNASGNRNVGIISYFSSNNTISQNNVSNSRYGFYLYSSSSNTFTRNRILNNSMYGSFFDSTTNNNTIYNNYFNNVNNTLDNSSRGNSWNITKTEGVNIIGGPNLGGNYWSNYHGLDTSTPPDGLGDTYIPFTDGNTITNGGDWLPLTSNMSLVADFTTNITSGYVPLTVKFTDISTGSPMPTIVNLSFGDGEWTNLTGSWIHTYTHEGTFFPVIYASNGISNTTGTNATISVNVTPGLEKGLAEAYNIVLNNATILDGTSAGKLVSASQVQIPAGSMVQPWGDKLAIVSPPTPAWFIFIDDYPGANWEHPCRYVFVDDDGQTTVVEAMSPPTNIYPDQIAGEIQDPRGDANSVTSLSQNPGGGLGTLNLELACSAPDCRNNYALLISGGFSPSQNHIRYWNDISFMYQTLNQTYGYPANRITVLLSDGIGTSADRHNATEANGVVRTDNSPVDLDVLFGPGDVTGDAKKSTVITTLSNLNIQLSAKDSLFIFTTSHGGWDGVPASNNSILYLWDQEYISDTEFVNALPTSPGNITMVMEQCYSGGFIDNFINNYAGTQRRVIATASTGSEPSWGNGFSNAWTSGMARIDEARLPNFRADITPIDGRISMWEAYNYSVYYDPAALPSLPNHEHPQYNAKNSATLGTTQYLSSCPVQTTPTIKVTTPNAAESWKKGSTYFITWTQTGLTQSNVNISLWKGTSRQQYIAEVPASSSRYFWLVPTTLATATDYRINISSVGTTPTVFDRSDTDFGIVPATGPGYLWVNTTPVQLATIYIDGVVTGTTNTKLTLPNGEHNVTVTKADYYSMQSTANVKTDQTSAAIFVLERINEADFYPYGSIVIDSEPHGAEVVIDEDSTGLTTPASTEIMNGNHAVYVIADGYETPTTKTVYVPEHGTVNLEFTLTRSPSVLPLPGYTNPPTDPDGDGLYEDLNCNGFADWDDAVVLFWNTDWIQEHEPVTAFDFNHNGFIDWDDAVVLFWKV